MYQRFFISCAILLLCAGAAGCSGRHSTPPLAAGEMPASTPRSISPALITPAPMAKTTILLPSAMHTPRRVMGSVQPPNWTQLPGSASVAAAAPDGSLWVLSDQPAGPDKYIWHYSGGAWTNIAGLANHLSVGPDGTVYALNSGGGTWAYSNGSWTALGGGAIALSVGADGSVYVLSNGGSGDRAIWRNAHGTWTQEPGAGVSIAASWDAVSYSIPGVGSIQSYGLWVLNSGGSIYHLNTDGTYAQLPGSASAIAPTVGGGIFVLGAPVNPSGNALFYYAFPGGWTAEPGSAVSLSCNSTHLYVIGASGAIYSTPLVNVYANTTLPPFTMQTIGPHNLYGSGKMQAIAANPSNPNVFYVAGGYGPYDPVINDTGVYGTMDGGTTWTALDNGLTDSIVNALWMDPNNPSILLAGTAYGGIYRSVNAGASWANVESSAGVTQFATAGSTLYAAASNGVQVSNDDGASWALSLSDSFATTGSKPLSLAVTAGGTVYAGLTDGTISVLQSGVWKTAGTVSSQNAILHLAADAINPQQLYAIAGTYPGSTLYVSTNGGAIWTSINGSAIGPAAIVAADPSVGGTLYAAGTDRYVQVSKDSGTTWTDIGLWGDQRGLLALGGSPEKFIDASDQGIQVCTLPGTMVSCTMVSQALSTNIVNSVTAAGTVVAAAMQDYPPASSQDGGGTWMPAFGFQEDGTILLNPNGTGTCYGFDAEGFRISTDSCKTFTQVAGIPKPVQGPIVGGQLIAVDRTNPSKVYVAAISAVYKSSDGGQTFAPTSWPYSDSQYGYQSAIAVSPANGSHIMLMGGSGTQVSFDGGASWKTSTLGGHTLFSYYLPGIAISPIDDNMVFVLSGGQLFRSTDGGLTFTAIATPPAASGQVAAGFTLRSRVVSPMLRALYKRNPLAAILQSQSGYAPYATAIALDQKGAPPYLALATTDGLFVSTDYGNDWQLVSGGTIPTLYYSAAWDNGILYGGSWGNGILKSPVLQ